MTTFADLINRAETAVNDEANAQYNADQIIRWLNDAVRDYSQYFPRIKTQTITTTLEEGVYNLNADFLAAISVEYPDGQDPPVYLSRLAYTHPDFFSTGDSWYDILPRQDGESPSELWISASPAAGQTIIVNYTASHELITDAADASDDNTVPIIHQPLLIRYVQWQASLFTMFAEQTDPTSNSSLLMAQLSQNARRMENGYHTAIRQALYAADGRSQAVPWIRKGDPHARLY